MGAWKDFCSFIGAASSGAKKGIMLIDNEFQDALEQQQYERERTNVLDKLNADIEFIREYKKLVNQLKYTGATRAQIKQVLIANLPQNENINIDELLKTE